MTCRRRPGLRAILAAFRVAERILCVSRVCVICAKKPGFGNNRSHSMVATKRRFEPNLQKIRILLNGSPTRAYVCTRCLKGGKVTKAI